MYKVILMFEDEQIKDVADEIFEYREDAALFGLGCLRAYRFIAKATESMYGGSFPLDVDAAIGFELVEVTSFKECFDGTDLRRLTYHSGESRKDA